MTPKLTPHGPNLQSGAGNEKRQLPSNTDRDPNQKIPEQDSSTPLMTPELPHKIIQSEEEKLTTEYRMEELKIYPN